MKLKTLVGLGAAMLLSSVVSVWAQTPIRVSINGGAPTQHAASSAINITIPGTITSTVTVHVYDVNSLDVNGGVPSNSIGPVTVSGTVETSGTPLVQVVVADGDTGFLPMTPPDPMSVGAIDFAGLSFSSTALRDISRVAVAVGGDITGNIKAGAIRRIQARGRMVSSTYTGGKITGNITATAPDFSGVTGGFRAIGVIWAGDEISGTIAATSDDETNPGGLTWLLVGHESNTSPGGLLGDVRIDYGTIEKVHTAGPIGSSTVTPNIWAGRRPNHTRSIHSVNQ